VVAVDRSRAVPRWDFGLDAVDLQDSAEVTVFRNWKPALFTGAAPALRPTRPVPLLAPAAGVADDPFDAALHSARREKEGLLAELADMSELSVEDVRQIAREHRLSLDQLRARVERWRGPRTPAAGPDVRAAALTFFQRLRTFVTPYCRTAGVGDPGDLPVRLCVPAFRPAGAEMTPAELGLLDILREAGWRPDAEHPIVSEPYANAVGTLTGGANAVHVPKGHKSPRVHLGTMFAGGSLVKAWRAATAYAVLVIDVAASDRDPVGAAGRRRPGGAVDDGPAAGGRRLVSAAAVAPPRRDQTVAARAQPADS
jgi:hypothetical protein